MALAGRSAVGWSHVRCTMPIVDELMPRPPSPLSDEQKQNACEDLATGMTVSGISRRLSIRWQPVMRVQQEGSGPFDHRFAGADGSMSSFSDRKNSRTDRLFQVLWVDREHVVR